jgi:hypothetical protein
MANHPLAFDFISLFMIEAKHYADLNFEAFLFDFEAKSFLGAVLAKSNKEAKRAGVWPLVIAKQNRRPTMLICEREVGLALLAAVGARVGIPRHHWLHSGRTFMAPFEGILAQAVPSRFLAACKVLKANK